MPQHYVILPWYVVNTFWPGEATWWHQSTFAQLMVSCLTAPRHYLNQCWLIISKVLWQSPKGNFITIIYPWYEFENYKFEIEAASSKGQWVIPGLIFQPIMKVKLFTYFNSKYKLTIQYLSLLQQHKVDWIGTLMARQNGPHFANIFKFIFLSENCFILIEVGSQAVNR